MAGLQAHDEPPEGAKRLALAAREVRTRFNTLRLPSAGHCRDLALATALSVRDFESPVVLCYGTVDVGGDRHEHFWCRYEGWIVDPTGDQFGAADQVVFAPEALLANYAETFFFCVWADDVFKLLGL